MHETTDCKCCENPSTWVLGKEYARNDGSKARYLGRIKNEKYPLVLVFGPPGEESVARYSEDGKYYMSERAAVYRKYDILPPFPTETEKPIIDKMKKICRDADETLLLEILREIRKK